MELLAESAVKKKGGGRVHKRQSDLMRFVERGQYKLIMLTVFCVQVSEDVLCDGVVCNFG